MLTFLGFYCNFLIVRRDPYMLKTTRITYGYNTT